MDPFEQLALAGQALGRAAVAGVRRGVSAPWLYDFAMHAGVVLLFWNFAHPALSSIVAPALRDLAGPAALHYPAGPLAIPAVLARADRLAGVVLLPIIAAWSAALFAGGYERQAPRPMEALFEVLRRAPRLLVAGVPLVLARGLAIDLERAALAGLARRPLLDLASGFGAVVAEVLVFAVAALVLPLLATDDARLSELRWKLPQAWGLAGGAAVGIGCAMTLMGFVSRIAVAHLEQVAAASQPDHVPLLALAGALAGSAGGLLFCGACTIIHISLVREEP